MASGPGQDFTRPGQAALYKAGAASRANTGKPSGSSASTQRANAARAASLKKQGAAYKASGQLSANGKQFFGRPDPANALEAWLAARDMVDGGSGGGGGGGGGGGSAGNGAEIAAMKGVANQRNAGQKQQLDDLYGDYAKLIANNPELTKQTYATLRQDSAAGGQAIAAQAGARQDQADAGRAAAFSTLGISPEAVAASPSESKTATQEGLTDLAGQNSSWSNLQGVLGAAQEARDRVDIQGVGDAKVLAHRQLAQNYEDFMRNLDAQLIASSSGGGGGGYSGGGSGGGGVTNKYRGMLDDAIFKDLLKANGIGGSPSSSSEAPAKPKTTTQVKYNSAGKPIGKTVSTTK